MIRHMRHGSSPRLMAFQPIRVLDPGESLTDPIGRSPYQRKLGLPFSAPNCGLHASTYYIRVYLCGQVRETKPLRDCGGWPHVHQWLLTSKPVSPRAFSLADSTGTAMRL